MAHALSRLPKAQVLALSVLKSTWLQIVAEAYAGHTDTTHILQSLVVHSPSRLYVLKDGLILYKDIYYCCQLNLNSFESLSDPAQYTNWRPFWILSDITKVKETVRLGRHEKDDTTIVYVVLHLYINRQNLNGFPTQDFFNHYPFRWVPIKWSQWTSLKVFQPRTTLTA